MIEGPYTPADLEKLPPHEKGVYILIVKLESCVELSTGALGKHRYKPGFYAYAGSAMGGLKGRLGRYIQKTSRKKHWHIDYLLEQATPHCFYIAKTGDKTRECKLSKLLATLSDEIPVQGFGSSDCKCISHLYYFKNEDNILTLSL